MNYFLIIEFEKNNCSYNLFKLNNSKTYIIEKIDFFNNENIVLFNKEDYIYLKHPFRKKIIEDKLILSIKQLKLTLNKYNIHTNNLQIHIYVSDSYIHYNSLLQKNNECNINTFDDYDAIKHDNYQSDKCTFNIKQLFDKYKYLFNNENLKLNSYINTDEGLYESLSCINQITNFKSKYSNFKLKNGSYLFLFLNSISIQMSYINTLDNNINDIDISKIERKILFTIENLKDKKQNNEFKKNIITRLKDLIKHHKTGKLNICFCSSSSYLINKLYNLHKKKSNTSKELEFLELSSNIKPINKTLFNSLFNISTQILKNEFKQDELIVYTICNIVRNYISKLNFNYNIFSFIGIRNEKITPLKGVIINYKIKKNLLILLGSTGSGKASLPLKVSKYINDFNNEKNDLKWKKFLIDDLVETNLGYKKDFNNIIKNECNGKLELCDNLKQKIENFDSKFINKINDSYFNNRFLTDCESGKQLKKKMDYKSILKKYKLVKKEDFKIKTSSCNDKLYVDLLQSFKNKDNVVWEVTGKCSKDSRTVINLFNDKLFNFGSIINNILNTNYNIIYAYTITSLCELIKRNNKRGINSTHKYIKSIKNTRNTRKTKKLHAPRFPDVSFTPYKKNLKKIIKCLDMLINRCINTHDCFIKPHILIYDNTTYDTVILFDSHRDNFENKRKLIHKVLNFNVKKCS